MTAHRNFPPVNLKITSAVIAALLCLLLSSTNVSADPGIPKPAAPDCIAVFDKIGWPDVLPKKRAKLAGKIVNLERLKQEAIVLDVSLDSQAQLPELGEKTYVYVISSDGKMALIERIIDPGAEAMKSPKTEFLGSHEGLYRMLQSQSPNGSVELLAAGEVVIRNGRVFAISNGSGTFRGKTENLNFALSKLKQAGLKIEHGKTEYRDYSVKKYKDPHDVEGVASIKARHNLQRPEMAGIMTEARRVMKLVDVKFQNPFEDFYLPAARSTEDEALKATYRDVSELLTRWRTADEDEWLTIHAAMKGEPARILRALRILEERAALIPDTPK